MDTPEYTTKRCTKCGGEKPATPEYFYQRKESTDGLRHTCKQCWTDQSSQYYLDNREHKIEQFRQYRLKNREKMAEYAHKWYLENREKLAEYDRKYYLDNRENIIKQSRRWYLANSEKMAENNRQYRLANPHIARAARHRYRARKLALPNIWTAADWLKCLDYWNYMCAVCGYPLRDIFNSVEIHADHWIPLSDKRKDNPGTVATNMICLCDNCNHTKNDKNPDAWLISQYGKRKASQILKRITDYFEWVQTPKEQ